MTTAELLKTHVEQALVSLSLGTSQSLPVVTVKSSKRPHHGDFSCGVAIQLAHGQNLLAMELALKIAASITESRRLDVCDVNVSEPGFINFNLNSEFISSVLFEIHSHLAEEENACSVIGCDIGTRNCYELCCSILRCATEPSFDLINEIELPPFFQTREWHECKVEYKKKKHSLDACFDKDPDLFMRQKRLVLMLERAVSSRAVQAGPAISESFAKFYQASRVFTDQPELTKARLGLVLAVKLVLEQTFRLQSEKACELR